MNTKTAFRRAKPLKPYVLVNMAMTADAKIATVNRAISTFGSKRDHDHLYELRATVDAVMSGARTVDSNQVTLGPGSLKYRRQRIKRGLAEYNLRIIVSGSGTINPQAEIFQQRFSPIIVLTTQRASPESLALLRTLAAEVKICGRSEVDLPAAMRWLRDQWRVKRLLCEGGAELNEAMFRARQVDEVYTTVCPKIFGGRSAPTMAEGAGTKNLDGATSLELRTARQIGAELFLKFRVKG